MTSSVGHCQNRCCFQNKSDRTLSNFRQKRGPGIKFRDLTLVERVRYVTNYEMSFCNIVNLVISNNEVPYFII